MMPYQELIGRIGRPPTTPIFVCGIIQGRPYATTLELRKPATDDWPVSE